MTNKSKIQRTLDFDLADQDIEQLESSTDKNQEIQLAEQSDTIANELFYPGYAELLELKRKDIRGWIEQADLSNVEVEIPDTPDLTNKESDNTDNSEHASIESSNRRGLVYTMMGVAASVLLIVGAFFLLQGQTEGLSEKQIAEFKSISSSSYSPEVIASIDRSDVVNDKKTLVTAYHNKDYQYVLQQTSGVTNNAEMQLLRSRVFMNLERYADGLASLEDINQEDLFQQDVYLWMKAEGALSIGDTETLIIVLQKIAEQKLPNSNIAVELLNSL